MTLKLIIKANGQSIEKTMTDKATAIKEAERIKLFPYAAEAMIYEGDLMVVCIMHCPSNGKGEKWRM